MTTGVFDPVQAQRTKVAELATALSYYTTLERASTQKISEAEAAHNAALYMAADTRQRWKEENEKLQQLIAQAEGR